MKNGQSMVHHRPRPAATARRQVSPVRRVRLPPGRTLSIRLARSSDTKSVRTSATELPKTGTPCTTRHRPAVRRGRGGLADEDRAGQSGRNFALAADLKVGSGDGATTMPRSERRQRIIYARPVPSRAGDDAGAAMPRANDAPEPFTSWVPVCTREIRVTNSPVWRDRRPRPRCRRGLAARAVVAGGHHPQRVSGFVAGATFAQSRPVSSSRRVCQPQAHRECSRAWPVSVTWRW